VNRSGGAGEAGRRRPSDGVQLYDKPPGITSHDAVVHVRRTVGRGVRVGHAGTLDPFATGLLLILIGRATRVQRFLMELPKTYEVVARFGWRSTTGDVEGGLTETGVVPTGDLPLPTGAVRQRPPAFSAVKVEGQRAYKLAREGREVTLPERTVEVYRFEERWRSGDRRAFVIECSAGTYVRSLISDLGDAYCLELRRTRIGPFSVEEASSSPALGLGEALGFLPAIKLDRECARRAAHGAAVMPPESADAARARSPGGVVRLLDGDGLIALARADPASGALRPIVGFRG
jgi:tRNA pseudouridine55 synthase